MVKKYKHISNLGDNSHIDLDKRRLQTKEE